jgi:hypothetical protein
MSASTLMHNTESWADYQDRINRETSLHNNNISEKETNGRPSRSEWIVPGSWFCEHCDSHEHPEREPLYSVYYSRGTEGPKFCSHYCLMAWKDTNQTLTYGKRVGKFNNKTR